VHGAPRTRALQVGLRVGRTELQFHLHAARVERRRIRLCCVLRKTIELARLLLGGGFQLRARALEERIGCRRRSLRGNRDQPAEQHRHSECFHHGFVFLSSCRRQSRTYEMNLYWPFTSAMEPIFICSGGSPLPSSIVSMSCLYAV